MYFVSEIGFVMSAKHADLIELHFILILQKVGNNNSHTGHSIASWYLDEVRLNFPKTNNDCLAYWYRLINCNALQKVSLNFEHQFLVLTYRLSQNTTDQVGLLA